MEEHDKEANLGLRDIKFLSLAWGTLDTSLISGSTVGRGLRIVLPAICSPGTHPVEILLCKISFTLGNLTMLKSWLFTSSLFLGGCWQNSLEDQLLQHVWVNRNVIPNARYLLSTGEEEKGPSFYSSLKDSLSANQIIRRE